MLKAGGTAAAAAGYALSVETVLAQAIKTDTQGIIAGDQIVRVGSHNMTVYEARPESFTSHPIVIVISEVWGVHEYIKDTSRRFAKAGFHAVAPELFQREGDVKNMPNVQDVLKIVLAVSREQLLGDVAAAIDWAKARPGARRDRVGVTLLLGRIDDHPGCGGQPGHQSCGGVVRPAGASVQVGQGRRHGLRRREGYQGSPAGPVR
jgi:hypothetical protein